MFGTGVVCFCPEAIRTLLMFVAALALEEGFLDASSAFGAGQRFFGGFFDVGARFAFFCDA